MTPRQEWRRWPRRKVVEAYHDAEDRRVDYVLVCGHVIERRYQEARTVGWDRGKTDLRERSGTDLNFHCGDCVLGSPEGTRSPHIKRCEHFETLRKERLPMTDRFTEFQDDCTDYAKRLHERLLWDDVIDSRVKGITQADDESVFAVLARATAILHGMRDWEGGGVPQLIVVPWSVAQTITRAPLQAEDEYEDRYAMGKFSVRNRYLGYIGNFEDVLLMASGVVSVGLAFSMDPAVRSTGETEPWTEANTVVVTFSE